MSEEGMNKWHTKMATGVYADRIIEGIKKENAHNYGQGVCRFFAKAGVITPNQAQACVDKIAIGTGKHWQTRTREAILADKTGAKWKEEYLKGVKRVKDNLNAYEQHYHDSVNASIAIREADPDRFLQQVAKGQIASFVYGLKTKRVSRRTANTKNRKEYEKVKRIAKILEKGSPDAPPS